MARMGRSRGVRKLSFMQREGELLLEGLRIQLGVSLAMFRREGADVGEDVELIRFLIARFVVAGFEGGTAS